MGSLQEARDAPADPHPWYLLGAVVSVHSTTAGGCLDAKVTSFGNGDNILMEYTYRGRQLRKILSVGSTHVRIPTELVVRMETDDTASEPECDPECAGFGRSSFLAEYFLNDYMEGKDAPLDGLRAAGYELEFDENVERWVYLHKTTGIRVWRDALDLMGATNRKSGNSKRRKIGRRLGFHYTSRQGFACVTNPDAKEVSVWASLKERGDAFFGEGTYVAQGDPQDFKSAAAVVYNNYKRFKPKFETEEVEKYLKCVEYCIPIITGEETFYDVSVKPTLDMIHGPGRDRDGKHLTDIEDLRAHAKVSPDAKRIFDRLLSIGRDVAVICIRGSRGVENARGSLEMVLRRRLQYREQSHGANHVEVAYALFELAHHVHGRDLMVAGQIYARCLQILLATFGKDHPEVAATRNNIAIVYKEQSKFTEALEEYHEALRAKIAAFGKDHPQVAHTRNNIAIVYQKQSKFTEALEEYHEALRVKIAAFGKDHPEVAATRNNIANVYQEQSKFTEALEEYHEALRAKIAAFGKDHPKVAATRNNIAGVYEQQSKFTEALEEDHEALRVQIAVFGKDHPQVAATRNNIAAVYEQQSKFTEALEEYHEALRVQIAAFGKDHPQVAHTRRNIELAELESGKRH